MRLTTVALTSLLLACGQGGDNAAGNAQGEGGGQAPVVANGGPAPGQQPSNGRTAPEGAEQIELTASPEQVSAGATVTLTLANGTGEQLGYNLCTSTLQTAGGREVPTERACTMELRLLDPGETASYPFDLPGVMEDGTYRFSAGVQQMDSGSRSQVVSNSIEVS